RPPPYRVEDRPSFTNLNRRLLDRSVAASCVRLRGGTRRTAVRAAGAARADSVAEVHELEVEVERRVLAHQLDGRLQVVPLLAADPHLLVLDLGLHLELAAFEDLHDLLGGLGGDALADRQLLAAQAAGGVGRLAEFGVPQGDAAAHEFALDQIEQGGEPEVVVADERDLTLLVPVDAALGSAEVVTLRQLLGGLADGVV